MTDEHSHDDACPAHIQDCVCEESCTACFDDIARIEARLQHLKALESRLAEAERLLREAAVVAHGIDASVPFAECTDPDCVEVREFLEGGA